MFTAAHYHTFDVGTTTRGGGQLGADSIVSGMTQSEFIAAMAWRRLVYPFNPLLTPHPIHQGRMPMVVAVT